MESGQGDLNCNNFYQNPFTVKKTRETRGLNTRVAARKQVPSFVQQLLPNNTWVNGKAVFSEVQVCYHLVLRSREKERERDRTERMTLLLKERESLRRRWELCPLVFPPENGFQGRGLPSLWWFCARLTSEEASVQGGLFLPRTWW